MSDPKGSIFKSTDNTIKFGLFRGTEYLGIGELPINNEVKWVTIHIDNTNIANGKSNSKTNSTSNNRLESIRLRVKCSQSNANTNSISNKSFHKPSKSKIEFNDTEPRQNKRQIAQISNQHKRKKNLPSSVTVSKNHLSYSKPLLTKSIQNKSTENNFNIINTEMYLSAYKKSIFLNKNINTANIKANNNLNENMCNSQNDFNKKIPNNPTAPEISTRTEYKSNLFPSKEYTYSLPNKTTLEDQIIDQSFENNIKKDEMIGQRPTQNSSIDERGFKYIDDDNSLYDSFNSCKNDFSILYDHTYPKEVPIQNITLESELYIEKASDLQLKYHQVMKEMNKQYYYYQKIIEEYNSEIMKIIKMRNNLALYTQRIDYNNYLNQNIKDKNGSFLDASKNELVFWNNALDKKNQSNFNLNNRNKAQKSSSKEKLIEIMNYLFNNKNPKSELITKAKTTILNPLQTYFLGKIFEKEKKNENKLITINKKEERMSFAIENLKNNLKSKMLPMISSLNDINTSGRNSFANVNYTTHYNQLKSNNSNGFKRIFSHDSLEGTKTSNNKSSNNIGKPHLTKHLHKKSHNNISNYRSKSKPYFKPIK